MIKENQKYFNRLLVLLDAIIIILSLTIAWFIRFKSGLILVQGRYLGFTSYLRPIVIIVPIYLLLYGFFKLYIPHRHRPIFEEFIYIFNANITGVLIFVLLLYTYKEINYSRYVLILFSFINTAMVTCERAIIRLVLRRLRKTGHNIKHILIIGYNSVTEEFLEKLKVNQHWGYRVFGILSDNIQVESHSVSGKENIQIQKSYQEVAASTSGNDILKGELSLLEQYLINFDLDEVFITLNMKEYDKLSWIIPTCEKAGVKAQIIPDYYKYIPAKPHVEEFDGLPVINIRYIPLDNIVNSLIKRVSDIVFSLVCLIVFSPVMITAAVIIKITSPGPIIFKQVRVGLNRKKFQIYKFRTMNIENEDNEKVQWTSKDDSRKTRFGAFMRKTSMDELPQLFNVLKGDMSLVGPRPERPYFVQMFREEIPKYMIKHHVRPGMTGWAQVNGWRGDTSIIKRIECDIYYIENWSLGLDIKILWLTIFKGFINKNAY
jgi:Undecaprenyl-phosphate glucose phosphotransferase